MKYLQLLILLVPSITFAQVRAHIVDPSMKSPKGHVTVSRAGDNKREMISKKDRDQIFAKYPAASPQMKGWDEVDKDIFWSDLHSYPLEKLEAKYSKIPKDVLVKLQGEAK